MVIGDFARGALVNWGEEGSAAELWALYTSRRLLSPKVSAFLDHLAHAFLLGTSEELATDITEG